MNERERVREREALFMLVLLAALPVLLLHLCPLPNYIVCVMDLDKGGFLLSTPPPTCKEEDDQW